MKTVVIVFLVLSFGNLIGSDIENIKNMQKLSAINREAESLRKQKNYDAVEY